MNGATKPPDAASTCIGTSRPCSSWRRSSAAAISLDRLVGAVERRPEDRHDADRVLVARRHRALGGQAGAAGADRHEPRLDVPVAAELLPADLHVGAHHQVRPVVRQAGAAAPLRPAALERHAGEHRGLARAGRRAADAARRAGRATGRRAWPRSGARAPRSAGTRPCRSCSCRALGHEHARRPAPSRSSRTSRGSAARCRRASARRGRSGRRCRPASPAAAARSAAPRAARRPG